MTEIESLLDSLHRTRIGVVGDFCMDAYWTMDDAASELSIETGLPTRPVRRQRYTPGGAGTIVNNLIALGVGTVRVFGVRGDDPWGRELDRLLPNPLLTQTGDWDTPVYVKPIRGDHEESRIDFGNFNWLRDAVAVELLSQLEASLPALDAIIVNEQIRTGIHTPFVTQKLNALFRAHPGQRFIVDCRYNADRYTHCIHKLNEHEAVRLGEAAVLFARWQQPAFVTRGARGALVVDQNGTHSLPAVRLTGPVDIVGAGDSFLAGVGAALAAGRMPTDAAQFGNLVAGVTVQKLFETGTASPAEILALAATAEYNSGEAT